MDFGQSLDPTNWTLIVMILFNSRGPKWNYLVAITSQSGTKTRFQYNFPKLELGFCIGVGAEVFF